MRESAHEESYETLPRILPSIQCFFFHAYVRVCLLSPLGPLSICPQCLDGCRRGGCRGQERPPPHPGSNTAAGDPPHGSIHQRGPVKDFPFSLQPSSGESRWPLLSPPPGKSRRCRRKCANLPSANTALDLLRVDTATDQDCRKKRPLMRVT